LEEIVLPRLTPWLEKIYCDENMVFDDNTTGFKIFLTFSIKMKFKQPIKLIKK